MHISTLYVDTIIRRFLILHTKFSFKIHCFFIIQEFYANILYNLFLIILFPWPPDVSLLFYFKFSR